MMMKFGEILEIDAKDNDVNYSENSLDIDESYLCNKTKNRNL